MTIAPFGSDAQTLKDIFGGLRILASEIANLKNPKVQMEHLSMGMSEDYEIAIQEGATMIRLGHKIFGSRS